MWPWNGHKIHWTLSWTASYCHIQNWQLWWGLGNSHISLQPSWRWETIPALDFIRRLIRHIPEKHFKMIRYGGLYARHREIDKNLHLAISKAKRHTLRDFNKWRTAILSSFGYDPLKCPDCKHEMLFLELYFNHKRVSLEEMYEKIMSKARRRWSSA